MNTLSSAYPIHHYHVTIFQEQIGHENRLAYAYVCPWIASDFVN